MSVLDRLPPDWRHVRPWTQHSRVLMVTGLACLGIGISYQNLVVGGPRWEALIVAREIMPMFFWGWLWIFMGFLSIISSRWPPASEKWGYSILAGLFAGWAAFHGLGIFFVTFGLITNILGVFVWGLMGYLFKAIAGLQNPISMIEETGEVIFDDRPT